MARSTNNPDVKFGEFPSRGSGGGNVEGVFRNLQGELESQASMVAEREVALRDFRNQDSQPSVSRNFAGEFTMGFYSRPITARQTC